MVLGVWLGFGRKAFGRMVLGAWFLAYGFGRMVWLWVYGFGHMVIGVWFWAYGFGRIVWTYDFGGTALQTRAGQAQKYTLVARYPGRTKSQESIRHSE